VQLPDATSPTPLEIQQSSKFHPFFDGTLGAIDGTHILCHSSAAERDVTRNRKGVLTQNCLAACSFDLCFTYFLSGWEGSTANSTLFNEARWTDFYIPEGRYYLADASFASSDALLVPYQNVRYHLSEWNCAKEASVIHLVTIPCWRFPSPRNPKELFKLHYASAHNAIERIFGILKQHFRILQLPVEYDMTIQALIPPALAALHNFIWQYDPEEIHTYDNDKLVDPQMDVHDQEFAGELGTGLVLLAEMLQANERWDRIADEMWEQYQHYLRHRNV
jgi:DDE superfamily endonuclease